MRLFLLLLVCVGFACTAEAQGVRLTPVWERQVDSIRNIQHHASAGLISVQSLDSVTFYEVLTGEVVAKRQRQGDIILVDSTRTGIRWTAIIVESINFSHSRFSDDSAATEDATLNFGVMELEPYGWAVFSSSVANMAYLYEAGGVHHWSQETDQANYMIVPGLSDSLKPGFNHCAFGRVGISRSGRLFGGNDSGVTIENPMTPNWKVVDSWDHLSFSSGINARYIYLKKQRQAWLDDVDNILIATGGLYRLYPEPKWFSADSIRFLRALPEGWYWHAPFSDWTYALACKSDSSNVSIVSLVTDSVAAQCVPTSGHIDTIYSDVQRNYVVTYDAQSRILSGFVVDAALIPHQVISSVEDVTRDGKDDARGLVANGYNAELHAWPNPADNFVHISLPEGVTSISITSMHGVQQRVAAASKGNTIDVPLENLPIGMYIVTVSAAVETRSTILNIMR
ncbi:MAG: T9SS type A sorting domain-containing protein [bacterium]|nr:T9SS type A sorting domain-containing protein [bacterium]